MLKKLVGSVASAILLLSLVLVGCEIPSDITYGENLNTIDPPKNVKAVAYDATGTIQVSWDPSKDAKSYDVYRRADGERPDGSGKDYSSKHLKYIELKTGENVTTNMVFNDIVNFDNPIQNGVDYVYTVVANSGMSTNERSAVITNASATSNTVTPSAIPAPGEALPTPSNLKISSAANLYDKPGSVSNSRLLVSWNKQPGVKYELLYTYKLGGLERQMKYVSDSNPSANPNIASDLVLDENDPGYNSTDSLYPLGYWWFPLMVNSDSQGGTITARAIFTNDYYKPSTEASQPITGLVKSASYTGTLNLQAELKQGHSNLSEYQDQLYTELNWILNADIPNDVANYRIYRAELAGEEPSSAIISDWTELTGLKFEEYLYSGPVLGPDGKPVLPAQTVSEQKRIRTNDGPKSDTSKGLEVGKYYEYVLTAVRPSDKAKADTISRVVHSAYTPGSGAGESFRNLSSIGDLDGDGFIEYWKDIQYAPYTYPSGGATKSGVIIKWRAINNDDLSVKYKIERAQIDPLNLYLDDQRPWETKNIIPEIYGLSRDNIKTLKADWKEIGTVDLTKVGNSERETIYAGGYYAPNSAYPNPVWVPGTIAEDHFVGFYIDKDVSLQTREYYAYRITAIKDGVEAEPVIKIVDKAPFVKYSNLQLYAMGNVPNLSSRTLDNSNSPNAVDPRPNLRSDFFDPLKDSVYTPGISPEKRPSYYKTNSIVLFLTAPQSEYIDDVDVEIWRRIVTGNPETPFDKLVTTVSGKLIREGNTVESGPDSNLTDYANIPNWYEYEDTDGLVVGVIYQYKAVIPLDGQARTGNAYPNKARTNITKVWTDTPRRNPDPTYVPESAIIGQEYIADALDPVIGTAVWPQIAGAGNSGLFRWNDLEITVADPTSLPTATTTRSINIKFKGNQASQQVYYEIRDNNQYIDQGVTEGGFPTGSTPGRYFSLGRLSVQRTAVVQPSLGNITKYVRLIKDNADIVLPNPTYRKTSATSSPANYPQVTGIIGGTLDPSGTTKLATNGDVIRDTVAGNYNVWLIMGYLADPTNAPNAVTQMLPGTGNTSLGPNANNKDSSNGWKIDPAGGPGYTVNALLPERTPALR